MASLEYKEPMAETSGLSLGVNLDAGVETTGISTPPPVIIDPIDPDL